jgi:Uncharacterized protein conserved in bacteria (DUF2188)
MAKKNTRIVQQRPDKQWEVVKPHAQRPSAVTKTQAEADKRAGEIIHNAGGGERITKGRDQRIRSKDTIPPGNDPNPPKDKEH